MPTKASRHGFTIVELLIVIVVVAILAAITIVTYSGVQARARDAQRLQDIKAITSALEMYYLDNGEYPRGALGSTTINSAWSSTADSSWQNLKVLPCTEISLISSGGSYLYAGYSRRESDS